MAKPNDEDIRSIDDNVRGADEEEFEDTEDLDENVANDDDFEDDRLAE